MPLDQRNLRAKSHRADRADQPCRAAADDNEVIARRGRGIFPIRRVEVGDEFLIVCVPRQERQFGSLVHEISRQAAAVKN